MKMYVGTKIGTKIIKAQPMNLGDYNNYRGWTIPGNEDPEARGYLVGYPDANGLFTGEMKEGCNYLSWSPLDIFNSSYKPMDSMTFGLAIEAMKAGHKVNRKGWNGKDMWLVYMSGMTLPPFSTQGTDKKVNDRTAKWIGEDTPLVTLPYIAMWTADKKWLPGWLASQTDILSEDWKVFDGK